MSASRKQSRKGVVVMHPYRGCAIKLQIHRDEITWSYTDAADFETHGLSVHHTRQEAYDDAKRTIDEELGTATPQPEQQQQETNEGARASVRAYLAAVEQEQDLVSFARLYSNASEACAAAGVTLGQMRAALSKGGAR